jgi:NAD(P)-dependent dehydrogenase (short-subunit alcohol dehydrogenase family)
MNLKNKVCLVTGANSGIGKVTARELARQGAHLLMLCRNEERAESARRDIANETGNDDIEIFLADFAIQDEVRNAAAEILEKVGALDILVNNAGRINHNRAETPDGIEQTLAINHLAPFLLTNLLMEALERAPFARIVNVASVAHKYGLPVFDLDNLQLKTKFTPMKAYGVSKLCNIMFTHELAKRINSRQMTANCMHPGMVRSHFSMEGPLWLKTVYILGKPFLRSNDRGAQTVIYLAVSNEVKNINGKYFQDEKIATPAPIAFDDQITEELWNKSASLTGLE